MTTPTARPPLLIARELLVGYQARPILPPLSFEVRTGEFWAVLGNNGSGKTTVLRTLLGLLPKVGGEIYRAPDMVVSYVPQRTEFDPTVPARVVDFVHSGRDRRWSFLDPFFGNDEASTRKALQDARCEDLVYEQLSHLSEGQKARAVLARALVSDPNVLVLDEPTSSVDAATERVIFELLDGLRRDRELAVVVVSHRSELFVGRASHAVWVDRADRLALAGEFDPITRSALFVSRHGPISPPLPKAASPMH